MNKMNAIQNEDDRVINLSLEHFLEITSFHKLFNRIKYSLQKEQKDLVLGRRNKQETNSYFNFMKFLFSSPDKAI